MAWKCFFSSESSAVTTGLRLGRVVRDAGRSSSLFAELNHTSRECTNDSHNKSYKTRVAAPDGPKNETLYRYSKILKILFAERPAATAPAVPHPLSIHDAENCSLKPREALERPKYDLSQRVLSTR